MSLRRSAHAPLRFTALLLCVLSLFGHLGAVAHQLFEEHVACAEHGDLIHADEGRTQGRASESPAWRAAPGEDGHDHCWTPANRDDDCIAVSATLPVFGHGTPSDTAVRRPADVAWLASIGVLSLAPKQSPPPSIG